MAFDIERFKSALTGGGDRASKFEVRLTIPGVGSGLAGANEKFTLTCEATSIPPQVLGTASAFYFGREEPLPGDRVFPPWNVTVINDEDQLVRKTMERWSHMINANRRNTTVGPFGSNPQSYKTDAMVYKYGKDGSLLRTYRFIGLWPATVSQIDLSWQARDEIVRFGVEFRYSYWINDEDILASEGSGFSVGAG